MPSLEGEAEAMAMRREDVDALQEQMRLDAQRRMAARAPGEASPQDRSRALCACWALAVTVAMQHFVCVLE